MTPVTGYCTPCNTILDAALTAKTVSEPNVTKIGKEAGVWYCVEILSSETK